VTDTDTKPQPLAHHTFLPWVTLGHSFGVVDEAAWKKPLAWNRAAAEAGERARVLVALDVFGSSVGDASDPRGRPILVDRYGRHIPDGGLVPGARRLTLDDVRNRLFALIDATPHLDWQIVTERPQNVARMCMNQWGFVHPAYPANLWLAVKVTTQAEADERIPHLLRVPAAVKFVACEPREAIDLDKGRCEIHDRESVEDDEYYGEVCKECAADGSTGELTHGTWLDGCAAENGSGIGWVTCTGGAEPLHPTWVRALRDQCQEAGVPFRFDGWGSYVPYEFNPGRQSVVGQDGVVRGHEQLPGTLCVANSPVGPWHLDVSEHLYLHVGAASSDRLLDGRVHDDFPKAVPR
jgi:protein gp37